jgi:hypothetical protein
VAWKEDESMFTGLMMHKKDPIFILWILEQAAGYVDGCKVVEQDCVIPVDKRRFSPMVR